MYKMYRRKKKWKKMEAADEGKKIIQDKERNFFFVHSIFSLIYIFLQNVRTHFPICVVIIRLYTPKM